MYAKRVPFTRSTTKGPQPVGKAAKKVTPKPVVEEPAKIEVEEAIDLVIPEPTPEEPAEEPTDGVN